MLDIGLHHRSRLFPVCSAVGVGVDFQCPHLLVPETSICCHPKLLSYMPAVLTRVVISLAKLSVCLISPLGP